MSNVSKGQGVIPCHDEIVQNCTSKGQQKTVSRNFRQMAYDVMVMVLPEFVMENPYGHGKKKDTEQGTEVMEKLFFHHF